MPGTFNMLGTHYWGCAERHADGSYITTEWITLLVPIIPLKSLRLRLIKQYETYGAYHSDNSEYEVVEKLPSIYGKQVRHVYKGIILFLLAIAGDIYLIIKLDSGVGAIIFFVIFLISYVIFNIWVNLPTR